VRIADILTKVPIFWQRLCSKNAGPPKFFSFAEGVWSMSSNKISPSIAILEWSSDCRSLASVVQKRSVLDIPTPAFGPAGAL